MAKSTFQNLQDLIALYLFKLKHLLDYYINPHRDFFDEIKSSHRYINHKMSIYQPNIIELIVYCKIRKNNKLGDKHELYNDKKRAI